MNIYVFLFVLLALSSCISSNQGTPEYTKKIYKLVTHKQYLEPRNVLKYFNLNESSYTLLENKLEGKRVYKSKAASNVELIEITTKINNKDTYQEIKVNFSNEVCISPVELESFFWSDVREATYDPVHILALDPKNDDVKMIGRGKKFTISLDRDFKGIVSLFGNDCQHHVILNRNIYKN